MLWSLNRKVKERWHAYHLTGYFLSILSRDEGLRAYHFSEAVCYAGMLGLPNPPVIGGSSAHQMEGAMTIEEFRVWAREGLQKEAADPEARRFRDPQMEADRREFMGRKEGVMSEPETFMGQMPVAEDVGECLECTNPECGAVTDGNEPRWSDRAVSPQGKWMLVKGVWRHHCGPGTWRLAEKVNPWKADGL